MALRAVVGLVVLALFVLALSTGCASRLRTSVRYDHETDFAAIQEIAWDPAGVAPIKGQAKEDRVYARSVIRSGFERKGLRFVEPAQADALVFLAMGVHSRVRTEGMSSWGDLAGLSIDLVRPNDRYLYWSGWATVTWYEDKMDTRTEIDNAVASIMEQYPPH
ncbi:MAG: DUF4136 domain-containing protein [Myxococcota bacterium]|nr:DUF4136 domain-containing protein [Myxococcota bacterium]